jgi:hypothetical protein
MTITALEYEDTQRHWKLERTDLGQFHLLVGASGAGKTAMLEALAEVCLMGLARPGARHPGGTRRWRLDVQTPDGPACVWEAEVEVQAGTTAQRSDPRHLDHPWPVRFLHERITVGAGSAARTIVARTPDELLFHNEPLPVVRASESAIAILAGEPPGDSPVDAPGDSPIWALRAALERVLVGSGDPGATLSVAFAQLLGSLDHVPASPEELREADPVPLLVKAHLARVHLPGFFERIRARYLAVFEHVEDVTVDLAANLTIHGGASGVEDAFVLAIKERGVSDWIAAPQISSSMVRAFFHLAALELAPRGTTIVIDGYASDLGGRCVSALTELLWQHHDGLQILLASQHPHVARSLPLDCWHVVTRRAGVISVRPAHAIPELDTRPRQEAFELLVHAPA